MRSMIWLSAVIPALVLIVSCKSTPPNTHAESARELFAKSVGILNEYTDSMLVSRDSAHLLDLGKSCDESITQLHYSYAPEVSRSMTEGQNDTLIRLTDKMVEIRDSLLIMFSCKREERDSLPEDNP